MNQKYSKGDDTKTRSQTGSMYTDRLFTGQQQMASIGLYNYGARFYSPTLGRFIQPDTIVPSLGNPQMLNRYSYVGNNPINYIDPTGHVRVENSGGGGNTVSLKKNATTTNYVVEKKIAKAEARATRTVAPVPNSSNSIVVIETITNSFSLQAINSTEKGESYSGFNNSGDPNYVIRPKWDDRIKNSTQKNSPDSGIGALYDIANITTNLYYVLFPQGDQILTSYIQSYQPEGLAYVPSPKLTNMTITNNSELVLNYNLTVSGGGDNITSIVSALPNETVSFNISPLTIPNDGLRIFVTATNACKQVCSNSPVLFKGWRDFVIP